LPSFVSDFSYPLKSQGFHKVGNVIAKQRVLLLKQSPATSYAILIRGDCFTR
jgi:hypothetical protein